MDAALKAIAEPHRRQILRLVRDDELAAGEIARHFTVSRPAISQHLRVLRDAGLVVERPDGTRRLYSAREQGLAELREFLEEYWKTSLGRLKDVVEDDLAADTARESALPE